MMTLREHLLSASHKYSEQRGIALATLASLVAKDGKFFARISAGGDCSTGMYERFLKYFADNPVPDATDTQKSASLHTPQRKRA
jgi:hypothetical protein